MKLSFHAMLLLLAGTLLVHTPAQSQTAHPLHSLSKKSVHHILTGADQMERYLPLLKGRNVAIFANQTATVGPSHLVDTLLKAGIHISKIFSPEHGFRGDADAGEHVNSAVDPKTGIPIISLYGSKRKPSAADLEDVDIMLFDIQDVGVRFYTYISSLQEYVESAIVNHRPLIILDRPNPNGYYVDGPVLNPKFKSFVGMQPIPTVYGMTIGEYAKMLIGELWLDTAANAAAGDFNLTIIPCKNYTHHSRYILPVKPSPNLPNMQSIYLYPSLCLFEGTPISLGRGTDHPFQLFGHPSFPKDLYHFTPASLPGAKNPPLLNQTCYGYDLSNIDVFSTIKGRLSLQWVIQAYKLFPDKEHFFLAGNFFNRLAGNDILQQQIKDGLTEDQIRQSWQPALDNFKTIRKKYLLYAE
ncbi:MAG: DUF1343 domain-containing protein [Sphingobacteriales bacterium]|nr:DUF1343 domain-containing protein [Sphingobacteriales bacterium]